jgi:hypothetical protein
MTGYKATPEQWIDVEFCDKDDFNSACILELRARVEALEAQTSNYPVTPGSSTPPPVAEPAPVAGGLVKRVAAAIHPDRCADPNLYLHEARDAILEAAKWLRKQGAECSADLLEQEAGR